MLATRVAAVAVLARLLTPEIFGILAIATAIALFLTQIAFLGLPIAATQATQLGDRAHAYLLLINIGLGVAMAAVLLLLTQPIAALYDSETLRNVLPWLALVPLFAGIQQQFRVRLLRKLRFQGLAISEIAAQLLAVVASIMAAVSGLTWQAIVIQLVSLQLFQLIFVLILARWIPPPPGDFISEVRPVLVAGLHVSASNLLRSASRYSIVPVAGLFVSPASLGFFDRAQQLTVMPANLATDQLQRVVVPVLSRLHNDTRRYETYLHHAQLSVAYFTAFGFLTAATLAEPLVRLLLGPGWGESVVILQLLAVGAAFRSMAQAMQWVFLSGGNTAAGLRLSVWMQPGIALLSLAGLPWGVVGLAGFNALAWAISWPLSAFFAGRAAGIRFQGMLSPGLHAVLVCVPGAVASGVLAYALTLGPILEVLCGFAISAIVATGIAIALPMTRRDARAILRVLRLAVGSRGRPPQDV